MNTGNIFLCSSTEFVGNEETVGIFDYLLSNLNSLDYSDIFEQILIVVPNQAISAWLRDNIARQNQICANINFSVLLGPLLQKIYVLNNPHNNFLDTSEIKFIIYEYLCNNKLDEVDCGFEINQYLHPDGNLDNARAFLFSQQLASIIQEYIYLRTDEIINLERSNIPKWQQQLIKHILNLDVKTYIDVYSYFMTVDISTIDLPKRMFIFGVTSLYPSQLRIINRLSAKIEICWYYQATSMNYYGDLLFLNARQKIQQKLLRYPDLTLDDLYLNEGNPILSALGQQSREFVELLRSHELDPFSIQDDCKEAQYDSLLKLIQDDIKHIRYRIDSRYRVLQNSEYYVDPVKLKDIDSIRINSCHNKMREVQVMFNELASLLNDNKYIYQDILVTAPNIEDYVDLIEAVFDNEYLSDANGNSYKLQYNITGHKQYVDFAIIDCIKLILNLPYHLPISYLIDVLSHSVIQNSLEINQNDITKIKCWISNNNIHFGYDSNDYSEYGFKNYTAHSLSSLLNRLVIGSLTSHDLNSEELYIYKVNDQTYTPYYDLDFIDIKLINKLITIVELLKYLRDNIYIDNKTYKLISLGKYIQLIQLIVETLNIDITLNYINLFIEKLTNYNPNLMVNLLIINQLINDYIQTSSNSRFVFNGCITVSSMHLTRFIPYKCIYVLGLNFGEFPGYFKQNRLSILAKDWYLADRNCYIEDKQIFLDTILAAQDKLYLSYIGRDEQLNHEIYPSPVLSLLIDTITNSVTNFWYDESDYSKGVDFGRLVYQNSLHPFSNRMQSNYSKYWQNISKKVSDNTDVDLRWDFNRSPLKLTYDELSQYCKVNLEQFIKTFEYTNNNLFKILGYSIFDNEYHLTDYLSLEYLNKRLIKLIYQYITKYSSYNQKELIYYLEQLGVVGYQDIGVSQYNYIYDKYNIYQNAIRTLNVVQFAFNYTLNQGSSTYDFVISGEIMLNDKQQIVVPLDFVDYCLKNADIGNTNKNYHEKIKYTYKIKILVLLYILKAINTKKQPCELDNIDSSCVVYRDVTLDGNVVDKVFVLDGNYGLDSLLDYYLRSIQHPLLIVPSILNKAGLNRYDNSRSNNQQSLERDLENDFHNMKIKPDVIFDHIIDDYFQYTKDKQVPNDIVNIYKYLAELRID